MAFSRESRLPFLDFRLVDFIWSLDDSYNIRNGISKWSLREAIKDCIPEHIYKFRAKRGFVTPKEEWQKSGSLDNWISEREYKPDIVDKPEWSMIIRKNSHWLRWRLALYNEWSSVGRNDV